MAVQITQEHESPLLGRKTIRGVYKHEASSTPSRLAIQKELAKQLKIEGEKIAVKEVNTHFGAQESRITAHIYTDAKTRHFFDPVKKKDAKKLEEAKASEASKQEEKAE